MTPVSPLSLLCESSVNGVCGPRMNPPFPSGTTWLRGSAFLQCDTQTTPYWDEKPHTNQHLDNGEPQGDISANAQNTTSQTVEMPHLKQTRPKMQHLSQLTSKIQHRSQLTCKMQHLRHNNPKIILNVTSQSTYRMQHLRYPHFLN